MNNVELIDSLSTKVDSKGFADEADEVVDIVYEVVCGNMKKYDSNSVADDIYMNWSWPDVLLLLKAQLLEYSQHKQFLYYHQSLLNRLLK